MVPKRVKQFYINVSDNMTVKDYEYVKEILNNQELELFLKLSKKPIYSSKENITQIDISSQNYYNTPF